MKKYDFKGDCMEPTLLSKDPDALGTENICQCYGQHRKLVTTQLGFSQGGSAHPPCHFGLNYFDSTAIVYQHYCTVSSHPDFEKESSDV